jgi:hypothetical protein
MWQDMCRAIREGVPEQFTVGVDGSYGFKQGRVKVLTKQPRARTNTRGAKP